MRVAVRRPMAVALAIALTWAGAASAIAQDEVTSKTDGAKEKLDEMLVEGIATNLPLHRRIVNDAGFSTGGIDIHYLENVLLRGDGT